MEKKDTIAAIATAPSNAGIGIIRISGESAIEVADRVFQAAKRTKKLADQKGYTAHYGHIIHNGQIMDEVLALIMRAPHSYTAEDTVEIHCHGGSLVLRRILEVILAEGARLAEPGEFTRRAFFNGRIDLSQAEAVMDIIRAKNDYALRSSLAQLEGGLSEKIEGFRHRVIHETAYIESALDDPEHMSLDGFSDQLRERLVILREEIMKMADSYQKGRMLRDGIQTVILGKPNAGKSSLLNILLGRDRAIVTDVEGTTRDTLEESIFLKGISLNLMDTAGIRDTDNPVEKIGVDKALRAVDKADLILYMMDASRKLDDNDREILERIRGKRVIVLLNKSDLPPQITPEEAESVTGQPVIPISARSGEGLTALEDRIEEMFLHRELDGGDEITITNVRHREALTAAADSLTQVIGAIDDGLSEDFYTVDLMNAYEELGEILGKSLEDDLADEIFGSFCMGK